MTESLLKLAGALAAIVAISMLVYTCSPYAPLDSKPPPLETIQQNGSSPPPPGTGN
jgi:hypothetical protein